MQCGGAYEKSTPTPAVAQSLSRRQVSFGVVQAHRVTPRKVPHISSSDGAQYWPGSQSASVWQLVGTQWFCRPSSPL